MIKVSDTHPTIQSPHDSSTAPRGVEHPFRYGWGKSVTMATVFTKYGRMMVLCVAAYPRRYLAHHASTQYQGEEGNLDGAVASKTTQQHNTR